MSPLGYAPWCRRNPQLLLCAPLLFPLNHRTQCRCISVISLPFKCHPWRRSQKQSSAGLTLTPTTPTSKQLKSGMTISLLVTFPFLTRIVKNNKITRTSKKTSKDGWQSYLKLSRSIWINFPLCKIRIVRINPTSLVRRWFKSSPHQCSQPSSPVKWNNRINKLCWMTWTMLVWLTLRRKINHLAPRSSQMLAAVTLLMFSISNKRQVSLSTTGLILKNSQLWLSWPQWKIFLKLTTHRQSK